MILPSQLLDIYLNRFCNRSDVYYQQWAGATDYGYTAEYKPVTTDLLLAHLQGLITIAWPPYDTSNYAKWLCFDDDTDSGQLDKLHSFLKQYGWFAIREGKRFNHQQQKWKDGHLWLFFDSPVPASQLRILAKVMMEFADVNIEEIFPKEDKAPLGRPVRGPLGVHLRPDANHCIGWFEGVEQNIGMQLEWLAQQPLNKGSTAIELAYKHRPIPKPVFIKRRNIANGRIDFVAYGRDNNFTQRHDWLIGVCPSCVDKGHDPTHTHLNIHTSENLVKCWGGCEFIAIVKAISGTKSGAA